MLNNGRFDLIEKIDCVQRVRKVLKAIDLQLASLQAYLEELEFNWRHYEGGDQ